MQDKFNFGEKLRRLEEAKVDLPNKLAQIGQTYFQLNFDKAQWNGQSWDKRVRENKRSDGKALLVSTGRLRQAMQNTVKSADWNSITWSVKDVPYAQYLNDGTDKMTARKFMGGSPELHEKLRRKIESEFKKILEP